MTQPERQQQRELEEERLMLSLAVLQRVSRGLSNEADALFLASELGLTTQYRKEPDHA